MKTKTLSAALVIMTFAFGAYVLTYPPSSSQGNTDKSTIYMKYDGDISKMPISVVKNMTDNYKNNQLSVINKYLQIDDARANWFSLEELKEFIYHVEMKAKNNTENPIYKEDLGIRMYYAAYPDRPKWKQNDYYRKFLSESNDKEVAKYPKLHTLVMIPTRKQGNLDVDFDPNRPETYKKPLKQFLKESLNKNQGFQSQIGTNLLYKFRDEEATISAKNHGSLFPPRRDGDLEVAF